MDTSYFMQRALLQARQSIGLSSPNPRVGCVIVQDGEVLGEGFTQAAGQAHAEVMAIRAAQAQNHALAGCTVYVTLEPCSHFGRTPPCVQALLAIQPARVVVALLDPNPLVAGQGVAALRAAGVQVDVFERDNELAHAAYELNVGFMRRMTSQRVYTRLKWAASADGKTALPDGRSQWITGDAARHDGHHFRARADVLVTGIGTVLADNPQLNVRGYGIEKPPIKCIVDAYARTPLDARLFDDAAPVWLAIAELKADDAQFAAQAQRIAALSEMHPRIKIVALPSLDGRVDLSALWTLLYNEQINEVHVEAGGVLNASLLSLDLIDEIVMYVAPRIVGAGKSVAQFDDDVCLDALIEAGRWHWKSPELLGQDLRLILQKNDGKQYSK